ncbi:4654_t:CDS:2 [Paraglomus occultum]|uniref:4654_t:CDS:1 n=1 Tax=Paraglomus occultum TaxID=144539 RepID=A0A9N9B269_9GLOM|nr:4654_t:CDS:2 [Paraglomus occultum]
MVDIESRIDTVEELDVIQDDPKKWPRRKKFFILGVIAFAGVTAPFSSTMFWPVLPVIQKSYNTTEVAANSTIGVFVLFMGICPLGWAAYSDKRGTRRNVYILSSAIFVIASIVCALSPSIWLLIIMRALQACGSSAVQSVGAGTLSDLYRVEDRGTAYGIVYLGVLVGPLIGPVIGGYVDKFFGWRWNFWLLAILGAILLVLVFITPETFREPNELVKPSRRQKTETEEKSVIDDKENEAEKTTVAYDDIVQDEDGLNETKINKSQIRIDTTISINSPSPVSPSATLFTTSPTSPTDTLFPSSPTSPATLVSSSPTSPISKPSPLNPTTPPQSKEDLNLISFLLLIVSPLLLLRYPNVTFIVVFISAMFAMLYTQATLVAVTFQDSHYALSPSLTGLIFLSSGAGYMSGSVVGGRYTDIMLARERKKNKGEQYAEMRLKSAWLGSIILPISFMAYGWCVDKEVFIVWPLIAMFFGGLGVLLTFTSMATYLIDAFPGFSASVMSVNICLRYLAASLMSIIAAPLKNAIGNGWLFTALAFLNVIGAFLLVIVYSKGREWRENIGKSHEKVVEVNLKSPDLS